MPANPFEGNMVGASRPKMTSGVSMDQAFRRKTNGAIKKPRKKPGLLKPTPLPAKRAVIKPLPKPTALPAKRAVIKPLPGNQAMQDGAAKYFDDAMNSLQKSMERGVQRGTKNFRKM